MTVHEYQYCSLGFVEKLDNLRNTLPYQVAFENSKKTDGANCGGN